MVAAASHVARRRARAARIALLGLGAAFAGLGAQYDRMQDTLFGAEPVTETRVAIGALWGRNNQPFQAAIFTDEWSLRLRFFNNAGGFTPELAGVFADVEACFQTGLLSGSAIQVLRPLSVDVGAALRMTGEDGARWRPFASLGVGLDQFSTATVNGAALSFDPALFGRVRAGVEWFAVPDVLSLSPTIAFSYTAARSGLVVIPAPEFSVAVAALLYFGR